MSALADWITEGLLRGFGISDLAVADHRQTPRRRPPVPKHVETYTVDPPRRRSTPPIVRVEEPEPDDADVDLEAVVEPEVLPPALSVLVSCDADRADLLADRRLPPRFVVLDRAGAELARFHGCEHATKFARLTGLHAVVRLEDGLPMTSVPVPRGWRP